MKKAFLIALLAVMLIFTFTACGSSGNYTLYFSLLDKDTGEQYMTLEDALEKGNEICKKYTSNHTQTSHFKDSTNDDGSLKCEQIVEYGFSDISEDDMEAMKGEFEKTFPKANITVSEK